MEINYLPILIFLVIILVFCVTVLSFASIIRPDLKAKSRDKLESYECGEVPVGDARIRFHTGYYLVALIFILFDVETVFLFPWAIILKKLGIFALVEMFIFIGVLFLGWIYAYKKRALEWTV